MPLGKGAIFSLVHCLITQISRTSVYIAVVDIDEIILQTALTLSGPKAILRFFANNTDSGESARKRAVSPETSIVCLLVIKIVQTFIP